jgi:hypothetical protein
MSSRNKPLRETSKLSKINLKRKIRERKILRKKRKRLLLASKQARKALVNLREQPLQHKSSQIQLLS